MNKTLFLAGASGAIGRRLVPLLLAEGWHVVGTTRSTARAEQLRALGVEPVIVDVFDAAALIAAVAAAAPEIVIDQLTDLPPALDQRLLADAIPRNAHLRDVGTRNLVDAATQAGVKRFIAQSVAFAYAGENRPYREEDALATEAEGSLGVSARGVASLEDQVLSGPFTGIVLRYGRLYGPGTGYGGPFGAAPLHIDAAAKAACLATTLGEHGIYNVVEDDSTVVTEKAKCNLGWTDSFRI
jgi:nucleoside-diphosphate-sugar epimerase